MMVDILHRVGIKAPLDKVYRALATREGVAGWWTTSTQGPGKRVPWQVRAVQASGLEGSDGIHVPLQHQVGDFLMSLKSLVETGKGTPSPDDVKIGNWH